MKEKNFFFWHKLKGKNKSDWLCLEKWFIKSFSQQDIFIVALRILVLPVMSNDILPKSNTCVRFESIFSKNL